MARPMAPSSQDGKTSPCTGAPPGARISTRAVDGTRSSAMARPRPRRGRRGPAPTSRPRPPCPSRRPRHARWPVRQWSGRRRTSRGGRCPAARGPWPHSRVAPRARAGRGSTWGERRCRRGRASPCALRENVFEDDDAIVAPEQLAVEEEGRDAEGAPAVRFLGSHDHQPLRFRIPQHGRELRALEADFRCEPEAHRFIDWPDVRPVYGRAQPPAVVAHGAETFRRHRSKHEETEIEAVRRWLAERDAVVVGPALRIVAPVGPVVLPRDRVAGERGPAAQGADVRSVHRPPLYEAAGLGFERRNLTRSEVRVATARREKELHDRPFAHRTSGALRRRAAGADPPDPREGRMKG